MTWIFDRSMAREKRVLEWERGQNLAKYRFVERNAAEYGIRNSIKPYRSSHIETSRMLRTLGLTPVRVTVHVSSVPSAKRCN